MIRRQPRSTPLYSSAASDVYKRQISKGQMLDFKYPQNFKGWDDKYEQLLQYEGFARALISTRKNHINLDLENKFINDSNIPLYTIWGDSDSAVVYNNFKNKLNKLMHRRIE